MTEEEYIDVVDLSKLRLVSCILRGCMNADVPRINHKVSMLIQKLEIKTRDYIKEQANEAG